MPRLSPEGFGPFDIDPAAVFDWLGDQFGVLAAPDFHKRYVALRFSESAIKHGSPASRGLRPGEPVYLTIRHHLDGDRIIDVSTRRASEDEVSVTEHIWWTLIDYRLAELSAAGADRASGGPPAGAMRLDPSRPPTPTSYRSVDVDEVTLSWPELRDGDVVACGSRLGRSLVAVVAQDSIFEQIALCTWPRTQEQHDTSPA